MMYYYFDEYCNCYDEQWFATEEEACEYCEKIKADYYCTD